MEVAPFFVDFHHFLSIFTIFYRFSRFTHFCCDLHFVAIYALFPQFFFGQNSLLRNITRFLHVCFSLIVNEKTLEPLKADTFLCLMQKFDTSHFPVPTPAVVSCALPLSRHIDLLPHATLIFYFVEPKKLFHCNALMQLRSKQYFRGDQNIV